MAPVTAVVFPVSVKVAVPDILAAPNTFKVDVTPDVPTFTVWPFADVSPALAVIRPDAVIVVVVRAARDVAPAEMVKPLVPVIKPNTFKGEVVPVVPTFTV